MGVQSVAIIGAGMAGITCASKLLMEIPEVVVFEQYAKAGGRMASVRFGDYQCDIGTQYFTAGSEEFRDHLEAWEEDWLIDRWNGWLVELQDGQAMSRDDEVVRYVGRPDMGAIVQHLAQLCDVRYNTGIQALIRTQGTGLGKANQWQLRDDKGELHGPYDVVISAAPAPVAKRLLAASPRMAVEMGKVNMQPSWIVMLGFEQPLNMGFDAANTVGSSITWLANNASKPGREGQEVWLLQVGNEWSQENADRLPEEVIELMTKEFNQVTGNTVHQPSFAQAHLWRHSLTVNPLAKGHLFHERLNLGACGDWCQFARVEGAFISGSSMAERVIAEAEQ